MNKENKLALSEDEGLMPELRFPEFKKVGEWKYEFLKDLTHELLDGDWIESKDQANEGIRLIQTGNIGIGEFIPKEKNARHISEDTFRKLKCNEVFPGDCLVSRLPEPAGRSCFIPDLNSKMITAVDCLIVRFDTKKIVPQIFVSYSQTHEYLSSVSAQTSGSTRERISRDNLSKISIPITSIREQQKIASCLSSLDDLTAVHSQKLELLKDHKKGLMQNLFPQDGEIVPKYRFPEFQNKGAWVLQKLEGLAKRGSGHTPNKQISNYYNGGINWVSLADSKKLDNGYIYTTNIQISKDGIKNSSAVLHPAETVILSRDAGVGKSAVLYSEMAVSQHFIAWVCDKSKLSNWFLYYVLQILKPAFESIAVGSTIKTIGLPYFKELCITVPSILEQQKIASCLSSLDALITAQAERIAQLKEHKRGLMQGLFPKINDLKNI